MDEHLKTNKIIHYLLKIDNDNNDIKIEVNKMIDKTSQLQKQMYKIDNDNNDININ